MVQTWLAARLSSEEGGLTQTARFERSGRKARANASARAIQVRALPPRRARIGRSRSCSRVVDVVAEVARQWPAQRSGRNPFHPIWIAFGDGRLARSSNVRKYAAAGEETLAPSSKRKLHVTVFESGCDLRMARDGWRWKASRIVVAGGSSRTAGMSRSRLPRRIRASRKRGVGHGEATGMPEARLHRERAEENAARPTRGYPSKRIGRLEPSGPPVSVVRGASPGRGGEAQASKRCWERMWRECS